MNIFLKITFGILYIAALMFSWALAAGAAALEDKDGELEEEAQWLKKYYKSTPS